MTIKTLDDQILAYFLLHLIYMYF